VDTESYGRVTAMPSQTIPRAAIPNVEAALIEQYGRTHVRQVEQSETSGKWLFQLTRRQTGKCTANLATGGVTVSMTPYTPLWVMAILAGMTIIGFLCLVIPGVLILCFVVVRYVVVTLVLKGRFEKMVANVERLAASAKSGLG
jgi:hypothetical protein